MNFASIRSCDISNGRDIGVSLFVQGCKFHCKNCFNKSTWDFDGGRLFTDEIKQKFLILAKPKYIKRVSILGGEPLAVQNRDTVLSLCKEIKGKYPDKSIWLYTGYTFEDINNLKGIEYIDIIVDGRYIEEKRDITLAFRGSSNQRIIDVKKSLKEGKTVVLYLDK